jgi:hypothetical protein
MTSRTMLATGLMAALLLPTAGAAAAAEQWEATSTTAMAITGNVTFSPDRITFKNGASLPLMLVGHAAAFETVPNQRVPADLYKVTAPADPLLLNGTRLCGGGPIQKPVTYIAVWPVPASGGRQGRGMNVFSGATPPQPSGSRTGECGLYFYETAAAPGAASAPAASGTTHLECPATFEGHKVQNWDIYDGPRPIPQQLPGVGKDYVFWDITAAQAERGVRIVCGYRDTPKVKDFPLPPSIRRCQNPQQSRAFECN